MTGESMYRAGGEAIRNFTKSGKRRADAGRSRFGDGQLVSTVLVARDSGDRPAGISGRPLRVKLLGEDLTLFRTHNGHGDLTTIKARQILLNAAQALRDQSRLPAGGRDPAVYHVRGCAVAISDRVEWTAGARESVTVPAPDQEQSRRLTEPAEIIGLAETRRGKKN